MVLGHIRNIHFPFDIEADTTTAVASEMVEELDLTDQDVPTIAEMIESEIRSHIPDWAPREPPNNNLEKLQILISLKIRMMDLHWLMSQPHLQMDFVRSAYSLAEHDGQSHDSYESGGNINGGTSLGRLENEFTHHNGRGDDGQGKDGSRPADLHDGNGMRSSRENCKLLKDTESGVKEITQRLESLLVKQQLEVDELKKKHRLTISDLLKELSPEFREKVFGMCKMKIPEYNIQNETNR
ncbi:hypothetical protein CRYUN_Cryun19dG0022400 [Craigia yunnanensis]